MKTKPTDLVCTPEQAIELKQKGVVQCSIFYFGAIRSEPILFVNTDPNYIPLDNTWSKPCTFLIENTECASAFSIIELEPIVQFLAGKPFELTGEIKEKYKGVDEMDLLFKSEFISDMVLSALEQKLITIEQINRMLIGGKLRN